MKASLKKGIGFGLTSGIITTLGLVIGLNSSTHSKIAVTGGIIIIAIADALSDALGMHVSQESEKKNTVTEVWESTISTFIAKFVFACSFIVPVMLFQLTTAILVSIAWGLLLIAGFSYYLAVREHEKPLHVIGEHVGIAVAVIIISHLVGDLVRAIFG